MLFELLIVILSLLQFSFHTLLLLLSGLAKDPICVGTLLSLPILPSFFLLVLPLSHLVFQFSIVLLSLFGDVFLLFHFSVEQLFLLSFTLCKVLLIDLTHFFAELALIVFFSHLAIQHEFFIKGVT